MKIRPPVTFQGGKQRLAPAIIDIIKPSPDEPFSDLCCGSGAVTIEAVSCGHEPRLVTMVDNGPWGQVWEEVGAGRFSLDALARVCAAVPTKVELQAGFLAELFKQPATIDTTATFLVLQAGSFGGVAVVHRPDDTWYGHPRGVWISKVDPRKWTGTMMPATTEIQRRMRVLCELLRGVRVRRECFTDTAGLSGAAYIDPPYAGFRSYNNRKVPTFDFARVVARMPDAKVWVSESRALSATAFQLSDVAGRRMGGVSGTRKVINEEWLSLLSAGA